MVNTLLTIEDVAKQLGVSVATVRSWVRDRKITYRKVGRCVRFLQSDIDSMIVVKEVLK